MVGVPSYRSLLITIVLLAACGRAPTSTEALTLLRTSQPALDSGAETRRVWADGPPWFSCAEVLAKVKTNVDSAVIRRPLANWRSLVLAKWVTLRDTSKAPVSDPGWCRVALHDSATRIADGWRPVRGPLLPTGDVRTGWDVPAGTRRLIVRSGAKSVGRDSASVEYFLTIAPNANGTALGADKDTTRRHALLVKADGGWRVAQIDWPGASAKTEAPAAR